jgi:hypothetical protein
MKRLVPILALVLILVPSLFAGGDPMFTFDPAQVGFVLPEDTEVTIEDGTWYGISESAGLMVIITETTEYTEPNEMSEAILSSSLGDMEIRDFEFAGVQGETAVYVYGYGVTTDGDGDDWEGYFGILKNQDAPDMTYVLAIIALAPASDWGVDAANQMVASLMSTASSH